MATGIIPAPPKILRVESGSTTGQTVASGTYTSLSITFSKAFPNTDYLLFLTMNANQTNGAYGQVSYSFYSKSTTGFNIKIYNGSGASRNGIVIYWVAMDI